MKKINLLQFTLMQSNIRRGGETRRNSPWIEFQGETIKGELPFTFKIGDDFSILNEELSEKEKKKKKRIIESFIEDSMIFTPNDNMSLVWLDILEWEILISNKEESIVKNFREMKLPETSLESIFK